MQVAERVCTQHLSRRHRQRDKKEQADDCRAACAVTSAASKAWGALMLAYSRRQAAADQPRPVISRLRGGAEHGRPIHRLVSCLGERDGYPIKRHRWPGMGIWPDPRSMAHWRMACTGLPACLALRAPVRRRAYPSPITSPEICACQRPRVASACNTPPGPVDAPGWTGPWLCRVCALTWPDVPALADCCAGRAPRLRRRPISGAHCRSYGRRCPSAYRRILWGI